MGRPREADRVDMEVESLVAEANGNGVEHHSPLKSNRSPSQRSQAVEPRKSDSCPGATASSTNETAHENGVITPVMEDGGAEVSKDLTDEEKEKKQQEQTAQDVTKRMWFVRIPKPQYISSEEQQDDENKKKKMQEDVKVQNSMVNVLKGSRDKLRTMRGGALTACKSLRDALAVKDKELEFYKQERKRRTQRMNVELPHPGVFETEKLLDAAIEPLEHRMNHESLTKAEENSVFKQLQKLRAQRKQVKENDEVYTKAVAEHEARMAEREAAATLSLEEVKSREDALRMERDAMWNDRTAQSAVYEELRKEADRLDAEVNEALAVLKMKKDALDDFKAELEGKQGDVLEPWRSNRRFSQSVRELIKKGQIDLARQQCLEETNKWLKMLEDDDNFRKEYHAQWAKVRADEAERRKVLEAAAKASASGEGPKIPMKKMETAKEAIDKAMKMAESRPRPSTNGPTKGRRKAPPAAAAAPDGTAAAAVAANANGHASEAEQEVQGPAEPHETLGAEQMKELAKHQKAEQEKSGVPVPAPAKPKAPRKIHKKPIVSIPAIVNDKTEFELPPAAAAFIKREVEVDEEEERERARLRNAEAARDAEARKERKRRKAEQKAQKARDALNAAAVAPKEDDKALKEPAAPVRPSSLCP